MARPDDLARQFVALTDGQDWAAREALLTEDCDFVSPAGPARGRAATTAYSAPLVGAFPDGRHQIDLAAVSGDVAVLEGVWTATHTGPLPTPAGEVPATGRTVRLPFAAVFRVDGDLVASTHVYFDQLAFIAQLGLVPEPQAA